MGTTVAKHWDNPRIELTAVSSLRISMNLGKFSAEIPIQPKTLRTENLRTEDLFSEPKTYVQNRRPMFRTEDLALRTEHLKFRTEDLSSEPNTKDHNRTPITQGRTPQFQGRKPTFITELLSR